MAYTSLSGSKLRAKLGASLNEQVAAPTSDFAQQQLKKLGWTEGTGLGKNRQGRATHITVTKREDNVGLGHTDPNISQHTQAQWWSNSMGDTLAKLSAKSSAKSDKKSKKKTEKRHFTDEELFEATGGARFGMRAQRRATGKWARTESGLSEKEEEEAKARVEWNGRGIANTILSEDGKKNSDKSQPSSTVDTEVSSSSSLEKEEIVDLVDEKARRKQKKAEKKAKKEKKDKKKEKKRKRKATEQ